ncbi:protein DETOXIFICATION 48-like [Macadamia integrifolia]|uniref:protein DETOXIFICATION 48-like n=1 Tax=Macadamia integrifolia TaxID=60698 RepID=UPI001C5304F2|nr:protein DETOXIFICATION 48-like [Macadamia integrifolia]
MDEVKSICKIYGPISLTGLILYSRAMISVMFIGYLGELELAAASLSIGFANITGYSIITGLSMGMEPICGQAFGAKKWSLLGVTLQRAVLILPFSCLPITILWLKADRLLLWCGQDPKLISIASTYLAYSVPDLFVQALLHPLRIYLRAQGITSPLATCAFIALILHLPINFLLVISMNMGIKGAALGSVWTSCNLVIMLIMYICLWGTHERTFEGFTLGSLRGWVTLLGLAIPSCFSVCLEWWWWYEFMILLCGLLPWPKPKVAAMGVLIQTTSLLYVMPSSISLGVSTSVSNELGANLPWKARRVMFVALSLSAVMGFLSMAIAMGVRSIWGKMFSRDKEVLELTRTVLPIIGLCELFNCPQTMCCRVLRGCARPSLGANINLGAFYLVRMPLSVLLGAFYFGFGFSGLWLGHLVAEVVCFLLMVYFLIQTDWIQETKRVCQLTWVEADHFVLHSEAAVEEMLP